MTLQFDFPSAKGVVAALTVEVNLIKICTEAAPQFVKNPSDILNMTRKKTWKWEEAMQLGQIAQRGHCKQWDKVE